MPSVLWRCWLGGRKGIRPVKNGGWWRWALVSPDGVGPSWMVCVSSSVNLPLHRKVQKFSSGTGSPGWSRKKGRKTAVLCGVIRILVSENCHRGSNALLCSPAGALQKVEDSLWFSVVGVCILGFIQCFDNWQCWLGEKRDIWPIKDLSLLFKGSFPEEEKKTNPPDPASSGKNGHQNQVVSVVGVFCIPWNIVLFAIWECLLLLGLKKFYLWKILICSDLTNRYLC